MSEQDPAPELHIDADWKAEAQAEKERLAAKEAEQAAEDPGSNQSQGPGELPEADFKAMRVRFVPDAQPDPYTVLGVTPDMPFDAIRREWRKLVRETHPDAMLARGVPEEALRLAEKRMIDINRAWEEINRRDRAQV